MFDLFANVFANGISFVIGLFAGMIYRLFKVNLPTRLALGFRSPKSVNIIVGTPLGILPGEPKVTRHEGMPIIGFGPFMALARMSQLLRRAYPKLVFSDPIPSRIMTDQHLETDLVLIGFPLGNEATDRLMRLVPTPLRFEGHNIVDSGTSEVKYRTALDGEAVKIVYGMIMFCPNPFKDGKHSLVLAGTETYGVKSAADFLDGRNLPSILNEWKFLGTYGTLLKRAILLRLFKPAYYQAIVQSDVSGHATSAPTLVQYCRLYPNRALVAPSQTGQPPRNDPLP